MAKILAINPGGTSTKIAIFQDNQEVKKTSIFHSGKDLKEFKAVVDELSYREDLILDFLNKEGFELTSFTAVVGRGGLLKPILGGVYEVNQAMKDDIYQAINGEHASNLGALLASKLAQKAKVKAYTVDPVSVDEFMPIVRYTGISDIEKKSWLHPLNHKMVARTYAKSIGRKYEDLNLIIAHLGSGISIGVHYQGKLIDGSGGRSDGPFSPERSGGMLCYPLVELCYSGKYSRQEMVDKVSRYGGFYDYLGTKDMIEIEKRVSSGDHKAQEVYSAFTYQIAKEIYSYAASLYGSVDAILLTGGIAHSDLLCAEVKKRVAKLAPVEVFAGEMEMEGLVAGVLRVLNNQEEVKVYQ